MQLAIGHALMFAFGLYLCLYVVRPGLRVVRPVSRWSDGATPDPVARACFGTLGSGLMVGAFLL